METSAKPYTGKPLNPDFPERKPQNIEHKAHTMHKENNTFRGKQKESVYNGITDKAIIRRAQDVTLLESPYVWDRISGPTAPFRKIDSTGSSEAKVKLSPLQAVEIYRCFL
jgi:hypothetical protein